jgi:hypothetical protein
MKHAVYYWHSALDCFFESLPRKKATYIWGTGGVIRPFAGHAFYPEEALMGPHEWMRLDVATETPNLQFAVSYASPQIVRYAILKNDGQVSGRGVSHVVYDMHDREGRPNDMDLQCLINAHPPSFVVTASCLCPGRFITRTFPAMGLAVSNRTH